MANRIQSLMTRYVPLMTWVAVLAIADSVCLAVPADDQNKPTPAQMTARIVKEADGVVSIEPEDTTSDLGKWKKMDVAGYSGSGYLEFTGNSPTSGPATSPLVYRFEIKRSGLYFLHLRCARETVNGRNDLANDAYVRLEGDYGAGPNPGDKHGDDAPLAMLKKNTKFFGGDHNKFVWASGNRLDPGGHRNKRVAVYNFKPGVYTLVLSGRSKLFKIDRIVLRHEAIAKEKAEAVK